MSQQTVFTPEFKFSEVIGLAGPGACGLGKSQARFRLESPGRPDAAAGRARPDSGPGPLTDITNLVELLSQAWLPSDLK